MKKLYYQIKYCIRNLWIYRKLIWNDRHWDHSFLYDMLAFKLEEMSKFYAKYSSWTEKDEHVALMKSASEMCKRIAKQNYCEKEWDEHSKKFPSTWKFTQCEDNPQLSKLNIEYETPGADEASYQDILRIEKLEEELINKDMDELFQILKEHSRSWWD